MDYLERIHKAAEYIQSNVDIKPYMAMILGSGLGELANCVTDATVLAYEDIPEFPVATAPGHEGKLVFGHLNGVPVAIMQGRFHYYEGYSQQEITLPLRVLNQIGAEVLLLTNAAGSIDTNNKPGDLMLIEDHINFSGMGPLRGPNLDDFGDRFPDMSKVYTPALRELMRDAAQQEGIDLKKGVYMMFSGPQYETPAEIRMARVMGASAAGMSTVPEAIVGSHCGMQVCGISCMTNMAAGILDQPLTHAEVMQTGLAVKDKFARLILTFCRILAQNKPE